MSDEITTERPKVTKIHVEYSDGSVKEAEGEHAEDIMKWWESCETMCFVHGMHFTGKPLQKVEKK